MSRLIRQVRVEGDVVFITLTKGYEAMIDACDRHLVEGRNWHSKETFRADGSLRSVYAISGKPNLLMHRVLMGDDQPDHVDHIDGNGLNNRRHGESGNLRLATVAQNAQNQSAPCSNKSGKKGVIWNKACQKWQAQIRKDGHLKYLGVFVDKISASAAYDAAAAGLFGDFARPNSSMETPHV